VSEAIEETQPQAEAPVEQPAAPADLEAIRAAAASDVEASIAESLGMSASEAAAFIAERKQADLDAMSELDRARALIEEERAAIAAERSAVATKAHEMAVSAALREAGASDLVARLVDVPMGSDAAVIAAAVEALRSALPAVFTAAAGRAVVDSDNGGQGPTTGGKVMSPADKAREIFEKRNPTLSK
jgi:hypothetical protein